MKRAKPWSDGEDDSSSNESSTLDTDTEASDGSGKNNTRISAISSQTSKGKISEVGPGKRKSRAIDFEALSRHGYKGGLSVLSVPPPKEGYDKEQDFSWSTGKDRRTTDTEESYQERQRTRAAIVEGEQLTNARTQKERKNFSFSQKEKRKRDIGQASRGKSYVEEEKRLLRDSGIYSGFDS